MSETDQEKNSRNESNQHDDGLHKDLTLNEYERVSDVVNKDSRLKSKLSIISRVNYKDNSEASIGNMQINSMNEIEKGNEILPNVGTVFKANAKSNSPYNSEDDTLTLVGVSSNDQPVRQNFTVSLQPQSGLLAVSLKDDKDSQIKVLQHAVQVLQGKIKGYETLGDLFQQSKQECSKYKHEVQQLRQQLNEANQLLQQQLQQKQLLTATNRPNSSSSDNQLSSLNQDGNNKLVVDRIAENLSPLEVTLSRNVPSSNFSVGSSAAATGSNTTAASAVGMSAAGAFKTAISAVKCSFSGIENKDKTSSGENSGSSGNTDVANQSINRVEQPTEGPIHFNVQQRNHDNIDTSFVKDNPLDGRNFRDPRETELVRPRYATACPPERADDENLWDLREEEKRKSSRTGGQVSPALSPSRSSASFVRISESESELFTRGESHEPGSFSDLGIVKDREIVGRGLSESSSTSSLMTSGAASLAEDLKRATQKAGRLERDCLRKQELIEDLRVQNEELRRRVEEATKSPVSLNSSYSMISNCEKSKPVAASAAAESSQSATAAAATTASGPAAAATAEQTVGTWLNESSAVIGSSCAQQKLAAVSQQTATDLKTSEMRRLSADAASEVLTLRTSLVEVQRRNGELEHEVRRLSERNKHLESELSVMLVNQAREEQEMALCSSMSGDQSKRLNDRLNDIQFLKQQLKAFKEDFDQERRDREKAKHEADDYRRTVNDLQRELAFTKNALIKCESDLGQSYNKNKKLESYCSKLSKDLQDYIRHYQESSSTLCRSSSSRLAAKELRYESKSEELTSSTARSVLGHVSPHRSRYHLLSSSSTSSSPDGWSCPCCTYINEMSLHKCELCSTPRPSSYQQQYAAAAATQQLYQYDNAADKQQPELVARCENNDYKQIERSISDVTIG